MRHFAIALALGIGFVAAAVAPCAAQEPLFEALDQATATVLEPSQLVSRASDLKLRIYPKAKSYVANYRILDEGEQPPGIFQVHLSASVATGRLARDLS